MPKEELYVEIFDAKGSPGGESLPFYSDDNAPFGNQLLSESSTPGNPIQKTLRNGKKLVMLDPAKVPTTQEKAADVPLWECADGKAFFNKNGYCQVWLYQDEPLENGKHGVPVVPGYQAWCELLHLRPIAITPTEPPIEPPETEPPVEPPETPGIMAFEVVGVNIRFNPFSMVIIAKTV